MIQLRKKWYTTTEIAAAGFTNQNVDTADKYPDAGSVVSIVIPGTVKTVGSNAFHTYSNLTQVTFEEGVETVSCTFMNCNGITAFHLPASITSFAQPYILTGLQSITVDKGNTAYYDIDGVLFTQGHSLYVFPISWSTANNTTVYTVPATTTSIAGNAFRGCMLGAIVVPDSLGGNSYTNAAYSNTALIVKNKLGDDVTVTDAVKNTVTAEDGTKTYTYTLTLSGYSYSHVAVANTADSTVTHCEVTNGTITIPATAYGDGRIVTLEPAQMYGFGVRTDDGVLQVCYRANRIAATGETFVLDNASSYGENPEVRAMPSGDFTPPENVEKWHALNTTSMNSFQKAVTSIVVMDAMHPNSTSEWFAEFSNCTSMNLANLHTDKSTSMYRMFIRCSSLEALSISHFDTKLVTSMSYVFYACSKLEELDLSNFETAALTSVNNMFDSCAKLEKLDISKLDTSKVSSYASMFTSCSSLMTLKVGVKFRVAGTTFDTNFAKIGLNTASETWVDESNNEYIYDALAKDTAHTYTAYVKYAYAVLSADHATLTIYNSYNYNEEAITAAGCTIYKYPSGTPTGSRIPDVTTSWDNSTYRSQIKKVIIHDAISPNSIARWFLYTKVSDIDSIEGLDNLDVSKVESLASTFSGCSLLTSDLANAVLAKFQSEGAAIGAIHNMFEGCTTLTTVNLSTLNLSGASVVNTYTMFAGCTALTSVTFPDTTFTVRNMNSMFANCTSLTELDLSSFKNYTDLYVSSSFSGCTNLKTIYVGSQWDITQSTLKDTANTFSGCTSLVGGNGTTYDSTKVDATYARIDGENGLRGYLTAKEDTSVTYATLAVDATAIDATARVPTCIFLCEDTTITLTPNEGATLPTTVTVKIGDTVVEDATYTVAENGTATLIIPAAFMTAMETNVTITTAEATPDESEGNGDGDTTEGDELAGDDNATEGEDPEDADATEPEQGSDAVSDEEEPETPDEDDSGNEVSADEAEGDNPVTDTPEGENNNAPEEDGA